MESIGVSEPFSRSASAFKVKVGLACVCLLRDPLTEVEGESVLGVSKTLGASWFEEVLVMTGSTVRPLTFFSVWTMVTEIVVGSGGLRVTLR